MEEPHHRIQKLPDELVNKIAAGEVIQRPANVVKELLENALDAQSTEIHVNIKDGGLSHIQIRDNGKGILKEDLSLLCERFTTSKLRSLEDLSRLDTFGFRGEALSSISVVSRLTVTTCTRDSDVAYRASYANGRLLTDIKIVAGLPGTNFQIQDLFYNSPTRKRTMRSAEEEFREIAKVVSRYAMHNSHVSIHLKKNDTMEFSTKAGSSVLENIRLFGTNIARECATITVSNSALHLEGTGFCTNVMFAPAKPTTIFFINNRLVEHPALKRLLMEAYQSLAGRKMKPFLYLALKMRPCDVDANVHPTKERVGFLHQHEVLAAVESTVRKALADYSKSKSFALATVVSPPPRAITLKKKPVPANPSALPHNSNKKRPEVEEEVAPSQQRKAQRRERASVSRELLRTSDGRFSSVTLYDPHTEAQHEVDTSIVYRESTQTLGAEGDKPLTQRVHPQDLTSVQQLISQYESACSEDFRSLLRSLEYVGPIDQSHCAVFAPSPHRDLFLLHHASLCDQLFYQLAVRSIGEFQSWKFGPSSLSVEALLRMAMERMTATQQSVESLASVLLDRAEMFREYFSIDFRIEASSSSSLCLVSLPRISFHSELKPNLAKLPFFVYSLAADVRWAEEMEALQDICSFLADLYCLDSQTDAQTYFDLVCKSTQSGKFFPSQCDFESTMRKIANTNDLLKEFERC